MLLCINGGDDGELEEAAVVYDCFVVAVVDPNIVYPPPLPAPWCVQYPPPSLLAPPDPPPLPTFPLPLSPLPPCV